MPNVIQIKRTTTSNIPTSNSGGDITAGELAYSYSAADGSGNESGVGKLFIGHADGLAGANAAAIIGGSFFTNMLDHTAEQQRLIQQFYLMVIYIPIMLKQLIYILVILGAQHK